MQWKKNWRLLSWKFHFFIFTWWIMIKRCSSCTGRPKKIRTRQKSAYIQKRKISKVRKENHGTSQDYILNSLLFSKIWYGYGEICTCINRNLQFKKSDDSYVIALHVVNSVEYNMMKYVHKSNYKSLNIFKVIAIWYFYKTKSNFKCNYI